MGMPKVTVQTETEPALRFFHPSHPVLTTHDYTKSVYLNLLKSFPEADVIGFWEGNPMTWEGRPLSTHALLSHLWQDKAMVPLVWDYAVGESLERFLVERDHSIREFYRDLLYRNNQSTYLPGRFLLKWSYPVMKRLFNADLRDMVIRLIPYFTENLCPHHIHRRVKKTVIGEWTESVMVYITDDRFLEDVPFDSVVHAGEQVKASPGALGLPPFEEVGPLSDTRSLPTIVWTGSVEETEGIARIDGRAVAHRTDFSGFCAGHAIDLREFRVPARRCLVMDQDYFCPIRKRIVLHRGCAYDAPAHLLTIRHRKLAKYPSDVLNHLVLDLEDGAQSLSAQLEGRHKALLEKIQDKAVFRYFAGDESMTLNDEHLVKGVSAKILRGLLTAYLRDGRGEFEYREFKRDFEISLGQKNANFEVRFYRLREHLKEKCPAISLEKLGRGRFELRIKCKVGYHES
jgi:hypothetical protein